MNSKDSTRPSEDASLTVAGVEGKIHHNQDANASTDKSPATPPTFGNKARRSINALLTPNEEKRFGRATSVPSKFFP
jgi:hypothetical protein